MRIIAGKLGGRSFDSPGSQRTHPMSDKVRGALFNALGDIEGLTVLDAFAGSGALSFEAVSRGGAHATALDIDKSAITTVVKNAQALGISSQVQAIRANASGWLQTQPDQMFNLVLCDPPYNSVQPKLLLQLAERSQVDGTVVFSLPPNHDVTLPQANFQMLATKQYGDATLVFYRRIR